MSFTSKTPKFFNGNEPDFVSNALIKISNRFLQKRSENIDAKEEHWAQLFREWLPPSFNIVTHGTVVTKEEYSSPEFGVIILSPFYPTALLKEKSYLAEGVLAVFECKLKIGAPDVAAAIRNCISLKENLPPGIGSPFKELHSGLIYGILSDSVTGKKTQPGKAISDALDSADRECVQHPRECIDLVCVSEIATWANSKTAQINLPGIGSAPDAELECSSLTGFSCRPSERNNQSEPTAALECLLHSIFDKLAWTSPEMQPVAKALQARNIPTSASGRYRHWPLSVMSTQTQYRIACGDLSEEHNYNEWQMHFS